MTDEELDRLVEKAPDVLQALEDFLDNVPALWVLSERAQELLDYIKGETK